MKELNSPRVDYGIGYYKSLLQEAAEKAIHDPLIESLSRIATSQDPNDKLCPAGYGSNGFIRADSLMPYMIRFENDTNATAPAQQVSVVDPLSTNLDWTSFELTEIGFGDHILSVPAHSQYFETTVPVSYNGVSFEVDIYAGIDLLTGEVYADFYSIDPLTSLPPDVMTGFLPPEDGSGCGQGHVSFTIRGKAGLPTGTVIRNVADISFDNQGIISTDQINPHDPSQGFDLARGVNTIDASAPTSHVASLPAMTTNASFTVQWTASDGTNGSGVGSFTVYVAANGGAFNQWVVSTTNTSGVFTGVPGSAYSFYCVASDNVGNVEAKAPTVEAQTTLQVVTVDAKLSLTCSNGQARLTWPGNYILQTATNVSGPYADVLGAISPFTNMMGADPKRFFRLRSVGTQAGSLQATISPSAAVSAGAQWQVDGGAWQNSGATVTGLSVGNHTVAFKPVSGWGTPDGQTVAISSGSTNGVTGTYTVVLAVPQISQQPVSRAVWSGTNATLSVTASGGSLSYQWQFWGTNLPGATASSVVIPSVGPANLGVYDVVVNNVLGSVISSNAALSFAPPPALQG
ncbi:MAG: immunoglobulin domain-containing protein, partial [Verrucomicrobia bacterium]|nr:immunoglobulin domain-containing protein [Verrucomicrobiota bacterium]